MCREADRAGNRGEGPGTRTGLLCAETIGVAGGACTAGGQRRRKINHPVIRT